MSRVTETSYIMSIFWSFWYIENKRLYTLLLNRKRFVDYCDINLILPVRRGGMTPQRFFKHNSAQNEPKLAKFLLIQVR